MKAVLVTARGGPEVMRVEEQPELEPGPGSLLVEVAAAGVNFIDVYQREGVYPMDYPYVPGSEGAGTVIALGVEVEGFAPGDRVGWARALGSYRQRHVVPAKEAVPLPNGIAEETAAAVLLQGMTAHYLAKDTFRLGPGDRCLIHAGAGGVGQLLTRIAKLSGAEVVTTVGSPEKAKVSRRAGADLVIDYTDQDFVTEIESAFGIRPLDVVYDGVGASTFDGGIRLLRPRGLMVTYGNASGVVPPVSPLTLSTNGSLFLTRPTLGDYIRTREELLARATELFQWVLDGSVEVPIGGRYPLERAAQALTDLAARRTSGKLLIIP
jgi:NADPH:quinone reductase